MSSTFSPNFLIKTFNIHTVEGASCVNIGNNAPSGFESYKKQNQGFGSISGDSNTIRDIKSLLNDKALIDLLEGTAAVDDQPWLQQLLADRLADIEEDEDDIEDIEDLEDDDPDDLEEDDEEQEVEDMDAYFNDLDDVDDIEEAKDDEDEAYDEQWDDDTPFNEDDFREFENMRNQNKDDSV